MEMESGARRSFWIVVGVWMLSILPSTFFPYWAFLDDAGILLEASRGFDSPNIYFPNEQTGRFYPAYQLYYSLLHFFFGFRLSGYYFVQSLVFLGILALSFFLVARLSGNSWAGAVAALLFLTASPVAENAYTLGKPEPRVLLLMLAAMGLFFLRLRGRNSRAAWMLWPATTLSILLAMLTKETTMAILVFGVSGLAFALFRMRRDAEGRMDGLRWGAFLFCAVLAVGGARLLYVVLLPEDAAKAYTSYPITVSLVRDNLIFYLRQIPDVLLLGLCASIACFAAFRKDDGASSRTDVVFVAALCLTGWAYFGGMLLWRWPLGYYLLVPAGFFSVVLAAFLSGIGSDDGFRKLIWSMVALILLSRLYTIPYGIYMARAQKSVDRTYTELMDAYADRAEPGQRLLMEEWHFFHEPVDKSNLLLTSIRGEAGLRVDGARDLLDGTIPDPALLRLHGHDDAPDPADRHPVKGDFVARFTGRRETSWVLRGVSPFRGLETQFGFAALGAELELADAREYRWRGWHLSPSRPIPRRREFSAGYRLYRVTQPPIFFWEGRWIDGWMGKEAVCEVFWTEDGPSGVVFSGTTASPALPQTLVVSGEGVAETMAVELPPGPFEFPVTLEPPPGPARRVAIRLRAGRTFNPETLGQSDDSRDLSVRISARRGSAPAETSPGSEGES